MKKVILLVIIFILSISQVLAKTPKSKFYDFSDQLIDGQIQKPTALYTDAREKVKFERLLKLKKSFLPQLYDTAKEKVFK
jgi:hypothetical protein|tara:strand:+ start:243 stop:482 length:240 start_codon:yes stop_codon:yes gene_type:complete